MTRHDGPYDDVLRRAMEAQSEALDSLMVVLQANTKELERIYSVLETRPSKEDVGYHRRKAFSLAVVFAFVVIFAHDQHVESCSPGVEAKSIITELTTNIDASREDLIRVSETATPELCTVTFPLHVHDDEVPWPNERAILGMTGYAGLALALFGWTYRARRRMVAAERAERACKPSCSTDPSKDTQQAP